MHVRRVAGGGCTVRRHRVGFAPPSVSVAAVVSGCCNERTGVTSWFMAKRMGQAATMRSSPRPLTKSAFAGRCFEAGIETQTPAGIETQTHQAGVYPSSLSDKLLSG